MVKRYGAMVCARGIPSDPPPTRTREKMDFYQQEIVRACFPRKNRVYCSEAVVGNYRTAPAPYREEWFICVVHFVWGAFPNVEWLPLGRIALRAMSQVTIDRGHRSSSRLLRSLLKTRIKSGFIVVGLDQRIYLVSTEMFL